jgi:Na+-translocating ferredoxin:NAD+ oxidoreductase RNF subunit RnfB
MSYTIASNICEGIADCVPACPVACIEQGEGANIKGTIWFKIDASISNLKTNFDVCCTEGTANIKIGFNVIV